MNYFRKTSLGDSMQNVEFMSIGYFAKGKTFLVVLATLVNTS